MMCTWQSISPGRSVLPAASIVWRRRAARGLADPLDHAVANDDVGGFDDGRAVEDAGVADVGDVVGGGGARRDGMTATTARSRA